MPISQSQPAPMDLFALRPGKSAVVSEISEATASSPVPPDERVNFHIGNPVQDARLAEMYARIALELPCSEFVPEDELSARLCDELGWDAGERGKLDFLLSVIRKSAPYLPRGGFLKNKPGELIRLFGEWIGKNQVEPLAYDFGEKTGRREVVLASGGLTEAVRVFFHALSRQLQHLPAFIHAHGIRLAPHLTQFASLRFLELPDGEAAMLEALESALRREPQSPSFVLLGKVLPEETRRTLRALARENPLFIIEVNDAPNHASLAREARMMNRTLRFLTPRVFSPRLSALSTVFVAGYHEFIGIIENTHFQLKGTPSAAEVELLTYLLRLPAPSSRSPVPDLGVYQEASPVLRVAHAAAGRLAVRIGARVDALATAGAASVERIVTSGVEHSSARLVRAAFAGASGFSAHDPLEGLDFRSIMDRVGTWSESPAGQQELSDAFKAVFIRHHPEYRPDAAVVVSGSARTALGMLGFHCGIREVVIPDLSWTYEHCFPRVTPVPLTGSYELDEEGMIGAVRSRLQEDPGWRGRGAVVFNNPHNATGQVFREETLRSLLRYYLGQGVLVIDDLSYQNVAPRESLAGPMTLRQLTDDLVRAGYLSTEQGNRLVTVHSLSKTDCLAGARLSVVEIRDAALRDRFDTVNRTVVPNAGAILIAYLFYRSSAQSTNSYWMLRNMIFRDRMNAIEQAAANLPADRNRFDIRITRPAGSMYPRMIVDSLPPGISLDWIASRLARQGIGLIPLSAFARTEEGFETGRKSFRLTLGGTDGAQRLVTKTRRVLIDLNRVIAEEESHYNRKHLPLRPPRVSTRLDRADRLRDWSELGRRAAASCSALVGRELADRPGWNPDPKSLEEFLHDRLRIFETRFEDALDVAGALLALAEEPARLEELLAPELYKDELAGRQRQFQRRLYDRTVHPTQMYSIEPEILWDRAIGLVVSGSREADKIAAPLGSALAREFLGFNVAVTSRDEGNELLLDLDAAILAEKTTRLRSEEECGTFLSYWGDWDGSNRPSGQGQRLVATVLMENVARMGRIFRLMQRSASGVQADPQLVEEIEKLPVTNSRFRALFDEITDLTHQLEKRYKGILPFHLQPGLMRKLGMKLRVAADPVVSLWEHNDRLERRMLELRRKRKKTLEYYFALNRSLRKALRANLGSLSKNGRNTELMLAAAGYRDLLRRFVITPRIHQNMITSADPFAIDTTVFNIMEINDVAARHGNPGMVLALQVSMSSDPEALISLDRKMRAGREEFLRGASDDLPSLWLVPLFEDVDVVRRIPAYLGKLWDYAVQSRTLNGTTEDRFSEMISELFIAGSDLSQQIGQTAGLALYKKAKYDIVRWLAERGLVGRIRIKMGSGEPMQRQGGYYAPLSGRRAFLMTTENEKTLGDCVQPSARRSTRYATTPLMGILASGDLRTFQSNLSERLRHLPASEFAQLLHHVCEAQRFSSSELRRAAEPLTDTRLQFTTRGLQELERLTVGVQDALFDEFMQLATENFRQILYGREEDVVGIYAISYFIARTIPPLRDRPTIRPAPGSSGARGTKILERIAGTIPFARYGSSLRAIAHHQAQTFVLGINQLTTGLFRALNFFARTQSSEGEGEGVLADRILPHLPVYEILQSLRIYHDVDLRWLTVMERGFPAGNSGFTVLREDVDSIRSIVPLFQKELVRRHGVNVSEFFEGDRLIPRLLPTLRPDLAVLLQPDLFNTSVEPVLQAAGRPVPGAWRTEVERLLRIPREIGKWRAKAWELLEQPVFARVSSFVELATALHSVAQRTPAAEIVAPPVLPRNLRDTASVLRGGADDSLQQFLIAALEYLAAIPRGTIELPTNLVRAMKEVERIIRIEEQALPARDQDKLRFYLLQIARTSSENG